MVPDYGRAFVVKSSRRMGDRCGWSNLNRDGRRSPWRCLAQNQKSQTDKKRFHGANPDLTTIRSLGMSPGCSEKTKEWVPDEKTEFSSLIMTGDKFVSAKGNLCSALGL